MKVDTEIIQTIVDKVMLQYQALQEASPPIPIGVSARHVHLSQPHLEALFGRGYELIRKKELSQPGQFAAQETVLVVGPKGSLERVRVLGPARGKTQVEVSQTDALKLGLNPPLRESGDIQGSSPVTLVGPKGSLYLPEGLIVAQCHIHMKPEDAEVYGVKSGEYVQVKLESHRPIVFDRVLIRVSERYKLEMHIDTDEANAALYRSELFGLLLKRHDSRDEGGRKAWIGR